jgi:cytochrome c556
MRIALLFLALPLLAAACAPPHRDLQPAQIESLTKLDEIMDVQATVSDPQFKKIGARQYSEADYEAFEEMAHRLESTTLKIHQFSKGPEFDAIADKLHAHAERLFGAASSQHAPSTSQALEDIQATCKECHRKFK